MISKGLSPEDRHECAEALVSVVVPTYSRADMLPIALNSINEQTYPELEVVVVDDNGRGTEQQIKTEEAISKIAFREGINLRYIVREKNGGGAVARNTGIEAANGEFIAFLDDDDWWLPEKIEKQLAVMIGHDNVAISYAHCRAILDDGSAVEYRRVANGVALFEQSYCGCIAATSQWIARKKALVEVGCFSDSPSKQDSILLYKLLLAGYEIRCVPEVLSVYNDRAFGRISTSGKALVGERKYATLIRSSYNHYTLDQRRRIEAAIRYRIGRLLWLGGNRFTGAGQLLSSLAIAPISFIKLSMHLGDGSVHRGDAGVSNG